MSVAIDLEVDLNSQDDSGLPWGLLDEASVPSSIQEGRWIVVGAGHARAVAQSCRHRRERRPCSTIAWPVSRHQHLLEQAHACGALRAVPARVPAC
jgi:hypothetical protein